MTANATTWYPPTSATYPATGTGAWTYNVTTTGSGPISPPQASPAPPAKPTARQRIAASAARIRAKHEAKKQAAIAGSVLPRIAGGAPEAEVEKRVEQKKKITLKRTVGIDRDKGGTAPTPTHKGEVTLVRDMAGNPNQQSSIGIKAESQGGSSYVEIPISMLREALDELDPPPEPDGVDAI